MKKLAIALISFLVVAVDVHATTYYLSPSGSDSNSSAQAQSSSTPWKSFSKAFGSMSAGDTLILRDGTYSPAAGTGCISFEGTGSAQPPSGTSKTNMTTIRAENPGLAIINGAGGYMDEAIFIGRQTTSHNYIKIQGIKAIGGVDIYNGDYNYIKDVGVVGGGLGVGTNEHTMSCDYNLIEDSWVTNANARIIAAIYEGRYNIFRRVVIRSDGCLTSECNSNPNVGITVYNSQYNSLQNVMVIDRLLGYPAHEYGDFATAQHSGGANDYPNVGNKWLGCISLNSPDASYYFEADAYGNPTWQIVNSIGWGGATNGAGFNAQGAASNVLVDHFTAGAVSYAGIRVIGTAGTVRNSISYNGGTYGVATDAISSMTNMNVYGAGTAYSGASCSSGCSTSNPVGTSLRYLPRIETGSALDGAASDGGDIGASVVYQYGGTGLFYDDSGAETLTATALWPWPNEGRIKADFASVSGGARGFATGNSRDATPQTLTKYIWEYLGNLIPIEIYGSTLVNGACGSNDGATLPSLTSGNVNNCSAGTVTNFTGSGPWTWDCDGSGGGTNDDGCGASLQSAVGGTTKVSAAGQIRLAAGSTKITPAQ